MAAEQTKPPIQSAVLPVRRPHLSVPNLYQVATLALLGAIFIVGLAPRLDTDLWWHLETGAYILSHHAVPTRDFLSFTANGRPWTDHEWLTEVSMDALYRLGGLWADIIVFSAVICASFGLAYRRMVRGDAQQIVALFVLAAAFVASSETWGARPQMLSLLFLAIYALILDRFLRERDRRLLIVFPALMLLWANLHGGWVLGLVLLVVTLAGEWLNRATHHADCLSVQSLNALGITVLATLAATIVNPAGLHEVLYPLVWVFPTAYTNSLNEWASADFHMPQMMVFEAMLLFFAGAVLVARPRLNWTHLLLALAFTHLALSEMRNVPVWCILVSPILARYLSDALPVLAAQFRFKPYHRRPVSTRLAPILNVSFLLMVAVLYIAEGSHFITGQALKEDETSQFPAGAVAYLQSHPLRPNILAAYAWGGYVTWKLHPRYRDFIDGRANTLFTTQTLQDYLAASAAAPDWRSILTRYRVQEVLLDPSAPLIRVLSHSKDWHRYYADDISVLYGHR